jgi:hypothetical protein
MKNTHSSINNGAKTKVKVDNILISIWILGPAVSLNGSPTVSPAIVALWTSLPLPPAYPDSTYLIVISKIITF